MSMNTLKKIVLVSSFSLIVPLVAQAGGMGGIVFDPTNYIENGLTARNAIDLVHNQMEQYLLQKYGIDANLRQLPTQELNQLLISKLPESQHFVLNYMSLLNDLEGHIGKAIDGVRQQYAAETASGLSPMQYIDQELGLAQSNQVRADAGFEQARNAMKQVDAEAKVVKAEAKKAGTTTGTTDSLNDMQTQLSTLTTQNQQMLRLLAARQSAMAYEMSQGAAKLHNRATETKTLNDTFGGPAFSTPSSNNGLGSMLSGAAGRVK